MDRQLSKHFFFSWRDLGCFLLIMACATWFCLLLQTMFSGEGFARMIYIMAVLLVSRLTNGYMFGLLASLLGVLSVNFLFTYPYYELNFTIEGYPLTFLTMLVVSFVTCALTTRIKQQERLRLESEKEKMRANLLRAVSHDIRTPLTSIAGATAIMLEQPESLGEVEKRSLLEDVHHEAEWLIQVVENLLSITRIGGDSAGISKTPEAAEEILGETVRKLRRRYPGVLVQVEAPEELLIVPMDPVLIEQVLTNLLENAVLHGKNTSCIRLSVRREGPWARFDVVDDGGGIPADRMATLFDGELRQDRETSGTKKRNLGLGLMVCKSIIQAHGGSMGAENLPGGADLFFRLPVGEDPIDQSAHDRPAGQRKS